MLRAYYLLLLVLITGCATTHQMSGFLGQKLSPGVYFKQEYIQPGVDFGQYNRVAIDPINTDYLQDPSKITSEDLTHLKTRLREELENGLREQYQIVSKGSADSSTLILTPALTYVATPKRALNAVTTAVLWVPVTHGSAAIEVKILDGETGQVIAEIAEKYHHGKDLKAMTYGAYTKYTHAEAAFKEWGQKLNRMLQGI